MEVTGKIKKIDETKTFGASGFRKREMVVTTEEQYPQMIMIEFVQDKTNLLDTYNEGDQVKVNINLRIGISMLNNNMLMPTSQFLSLKRS